MNREQWLVTFGATVKAARRDQGWTQAELAGMVGASRPSIANIEAGRQETPSSVTAHLAAVLRMTIPHWELSPDATAVRLESALTEVRRLKGLVRGVRDVLGDA